MAPWLVAASAVALALIAGTIGAAVGAVWTRARRPPAEAPARDPGPEPSFMWPERTNARAAEEEP